MDSPDAIGTSSTISDYVEPDDYNGALRAARELWGDELDPRDLVAWAVTHKAVDAAVDVAVKEWLMYGYQKGLGWLRVRYSADGLKLDYEA